MPPIVEYLRELHMISGVGVPETSGYPALRNLLNAVGDTLKPKIAAVIHPANSGAGIPDGGLFSHRDLKKHGTDPPALFDPETPVPGITDLKVRDDLKGLGELVISQGSAGVPPASDHESGQDARSPLAVSARWGYIQKARNGDIVMPGPGLVRPGTRGEGFLDIHLNATTRWKDVPEPVWRYTLGGYQVLKKWLSYREATVLGRSLTSDEALTFTQTVRRIAAILALHTTLDAHYNASTSQCIVPES